MTDADQIWNRALDLNATAPRAGDLALSSLMRAHNLAMNGGVFHAVELLSPKQLADAIAGYEFFGFANVAELIRRARKAFEEGRDLESFEFLFDREYAAYIPNDSALAHRFESHYRSHPADFAPL